MEDLGLNEKELTSLTHNAIKHSFCDEENKNKLLSGSMTQTYLYNFVR